MIWRVKAGTFAFFKMNLVLNVIFDQFIKEEGVLNLGYLAIFAASLEPFAIGYNWIFLWIFSFLRSTLLTANLINKIFYA